MADSMAPEGQETPETEVTGEPNTPETTDTGEEFDFGDEDTDEEPETESSQKLLAGRFQNEKELEQAYFRSQQELNEARRQTLQMFQNQPSQEDEEVKQRIQEKYEDLYLETLQMTGSEPDERQLGVIQTRAKKQVESEIKREKEWQKRSSPEYHAKRQLAQMIGLPKEANISKMTGDEVLEYMLADMQRNQTNSSPQSTPQKPLPVFNKTDAGRGGGRKDEVKSNYGLPQSDVDFYRQKGWREETIKKIARESKGRS